MTQSISGDLFSVLLEEKESSFVKCIFYDVKKEELSVLLKGIGLYTYFKVPLEIFMEFTTANSFGSFYHSNIKNNFMAKKQQAAAAPPPEEKPAAKNNENKRMPKKINKAKKERRFIDIDIDLTKVEKTWLYRTESGKVYAKLSLVMQPDGEVDQYGNLGFVSQKVPTEVYKQNKEIKSIILGNACELIWEHEEEEMKLVGEEEDDDVGGDLPF